MNYMKKNIGTFDRVIRLIIGAILIVALFFVDANVMKIILAFLGIFCFYEALIGWCAFYALIGKRTCPISITESEK